MAYFGSSQEEDDLEEEEEEEEEVVRNGGGIHSHSGGGSSSLASASSSCHSTPRKGKFPTRQPLNGHGEDGTSSWNKACHVFITNTFLLSSQTGQLVTATTGSVSINCLRIRG